MKVHIVKAMIFLVGIYGSEHWTIKEGWTWKNWCFWAMVLEKTLRSPFNCKEIKPVYPKVKQSWIFIWGTDAEAETPILWSPDAKSQLIVKGPDTGKDWQQKEKGIQRMKWLDDITKSTDMSLIKLREMIKDKGAWRVVTERLNNNYD